MLDEFLFSPNEMATRHSSSLIPGDFLIHPGGCQFGLVVACNKEIRVIKLDGESKLCFFDHNEASADSAVLVLRREHDLDIRLHSAPSFEDEEGALSSIGALRFNELGAYVVVGEIQDSDEPPKIRGLLIGSLQIIDIPPAHEFELGVPAGSWDLLSSLGGGLDLLSLGEDDN